MTPFEYAAIFVAVAGTAMTVQNQNVQAKQARLNAAAQATVTANAAKEAADLELKQYDEQRQVARDQATADEAAVRRNQMAARSSLIASAAARGLDAFGPTGRALLAQEDADADSDVAALHINASRTLTQLDYGAQTSRMRARNSIIGAETSAASTSRAATLSADSANAGAFMSGAGKITGILSAADERATRRNGST